jgi:NADH-quinone oxidoreductase subunit L
VYALIVFLPLLGAVLAGVFGRFLGDRGAMAASCAGVAASALLSLVAFWKVGLQGEVAHVDLFRFIQSGAFDARWALQIDQLTAVMLVLVTGVSAMVHFYSIGYIHDDPHKPRFFAYLSLFTFAMLMLVTADNFVQLYFGWEGVGLCSYLLIGFWNERASANAAAIKAFIVNRVGDFGFALGIAGVFLAFDSVDFATVFARAPELAGETFNFLGFDAPILTTITILLFLGAMGKSAQLGLHTWLPDAMEGPTPVSALIHAATMVTAGVFMVVRLSPLFEFAPTTLAFVTVIGALTAFVAATIGLVQNDIKRVIAYSTCSQLGYMFFAVGVSAYPAAIFHLFTHGFFKALLFLGAGSVIHAVAGEQDMRRMGGLASHLKITYALMWIGSLALAGLPFFSGFYSKDMVLEVALGANTAFGNFAFVLGVMAAVMTAFYSWRLIFLVFHGSPRADPQVMAHVHESPRVMLWPLYVLAFGSVFAGVALAQTFVGEGSAEFWGSSIFIRPEHQAMTAAHHLPLWAKVAPVAAGLIGILIAWQFYIRRPDIPGLLAARNWPLYRLFLNKWYFDELYDLIFVRPARWLGRFLWKTGDGRLIDGLGPDGLAATTLEFARRASSLQSGYVYHYAFAMLIGVAALVSFYLYTMAN